MTEQQFRRDGYEQKGLYHPRLEHDACGIGVVVDIKGRQSHRTVDDALSIVEKLEHRAGKDAEGQTGDGVGILLQISHTFFQKAAGVLGIELGQARDYGVGMFFFPRDVLRRSQAQKMFEVIAAKEGLEFLGWRRVPVDPQALGRKALEKMPDIQQAFVRRPEGVARGLDFDRKLYITRRVFEQSNDNTYVPSLSSRTIVYKGMFLVGELRRFYLDLQDEDYQSAIACVHSRFSTNTNPSWERAHPYRLICHNGEINTIRGNVDRMSSREETMSSPLIDADLHKVCPVVNPNGSDSAMLDNTLEFLVMSGMELPLAVMAAIPEPWMKDGSISRAKRDLYQYYAILMEPWDGPASILFSDGDCVGAVLDRNGLRPSRYYITDDGKLILSSEVGALDFDPARIVKKSRLQPGRMLLVDTVQGRMIDDAELKEGYAARRPYGEWLDRGLVRLKDLPIPNRKVPGYSQEELTRLQKAFGYAYEDVKNTILPMARTGAEPTAAMGIDIPLAVLSGHEQPLFNYFKQLFAQVTNPPIDAIREEVVTDTTVYIGSGGNLLQEQAENCRALQVHRPILTSVELMKIQSVQREGFRAETVSILHYKNTPLKRALDHLFVTVDRACRAGANIVILSDRGVDENHVAIPSLLAVSAVERYLIRTKKSSAVSIVLESAEPRDVQHFAALLGYGARAVNPYLAHDTIGSLIDQGLLDKDYYTAVKDYNDAVLGGIVKIASKMGISTLQSYQSAQIFEAVGIDKAVVDEYFTGTLSRVGGVGLKEIGQMVENNHSRAFDPLGLGGDPTLDSLGEHKARAGQEDHMYTPQIIHLLQESTRTGDYRLFKQYTALVDDETKPHTLRGLMEMRYLDEPIPIDEVESVESIVRRFKTGAMSFGSISREAHECMAIAMNTLGGKSNSGEGGEDPARFGTVTNSAIKQVASGRFGVTSEYLVSAQDLQIKMAQGAKPGEGGHLPGKKVTPEVAKTRHSTPGVTLISPPPHHDIYSIEDLAQLIYDLKNANRQARISVKLCAEPGVGTIAAGVAKAGAQVVLICGYDGGTGAAPRNSIHSAGVPWELGVAETHQTLIMNGLRSRIIVETDGKLMSGRDVAIACMLGAEEFGFATAALVAMGCCMMRVCNLGTCPAGIATQNPELRRRFAGKPEYVMNFMRFVAQELREHMARLGVRTVNELVGRTDLLKVREQAVNERAATVDLSAILDNPCRGEEGKRHFDPADVYDFQLEKTVDMRVLLRRMKSALEKGEPKTVSVPVTSTDRTLGTILGSDITRLHGSSLPDDTYTVKCTGGAGQSFGAFIPKGLTLELEGDCNDYMGKGLSGGKIIVHPPKSAKYRPEENIITGNVALYGATGGKAFINGMAGERFAVRNSGAWAVVEGVGDHGCEYMTGGQVLVLGPTGKNFAAGMSGGVAYVWDEDRDLYLRLNKALVSMEPVTDRQDVAQIRQMLTEHIAATGSPKAKEILEYLEEKAACFKKILPRDYDRMMRTIAEFESQGMSREQAEIEAFHANTRD
ncbi:MAG: glutamate synthase large subunit [Lawsonibacter sp.]|nr:glutamate synthase large subunit [Lawsonibacter sp.]